MNDFVDKLASLTPIIRHISCDKSTESPHSSPYNTLPTLGTYLCRRCGLALFRAHSQFHAGCGWPSFDKDLAGAVKQQLDADGQRTEILCNRCDGHLGHVFTGERFTPQNCRYCVNGAALDFVEDINVIDTEEAIVAGGCFWGVDYYLKKLPGVLKTESGYCGGSLINPSYEEVCSGNSGHYEAVRVVFDCSKTDYPTVLKHFFEIHDPTQQNGQGPDIGQQYQSAVFYYSEAQYNEATRLLQCLKNNHYDVVTRLLPVQPFWPAERYHQDYYGKHQKRPYCHQPVQRFS